MSKRFIIGAIIVLVTGIGLAVYLSQVGKTPDLPPISDKELAEQYAENAGQTSQSDLTPQAVLTPLELSHPVRLAVGGLGFADNDKNQQLGDLATVKLTGAPGFQLVERQSLAAILQELNLSWSGFVRAKDAVRAGKLLKADWFLLGTECRINNTNSLVVRVVDARTGIMRDAGIFPADKPLDQLAADLAAFMQESRHNAANPRPRIFLAVGGFEDLSVNDRRADFPSQLRGYLTAAYHGSSVTLLEREYVETLLQEVHLDLAGLTEEDAQNPPAVMQSAYWLVSGQYQSYETTNLQVELNLDIGRVFGKSWHRTLRGLPGGPVGQQIKTAIDDVMNQNSSAIVFSRASEARMQMNIGKDLCGLNGTGMGSAIDLVWIGSNWNGYSDLDPQFAARRKRNLEEAIRAFETVLLLEPANRQAKMYLAACCRTTSNLRVDDACKYYREIIDEPVQDQWSGLAQRALVETFNWYAAEQKLRWCQSAAANTTNAAAIAFYTKQAEAAAKEVTIKSGDTPEAAELARQRLFESIRSFKNAIQGKSGIYGDDMGMDDYIAALHWDRTTAAQKIAELLPTMQKREPELAPYLLATVLTYQMDANTPLAAEFQQTLNDTAEHPEQILNPVAFWNKIRWSDYEWCFEKTNYSLAVNIMEGERRAAAAVQHLDFDDQEKIKLAYAYLAVERWQDALDVFASFTNRPVRAVGDGPWGRAFQPILTDKLAAYCRGKLGLAAVQDPRKFDIGKPVLCLCSPSSFMADETGLWVGIAGRLLHLDFDLKTNLDVKLPIDDSLPVTTLCATPSKIWIGTGGAGLVEFDRASHQFHRLTQADGLMMDNVSCLEVAGDSLWIGYGGITGGGLGQLDLLSQKLNSFMSSLNASLSVDRTPPRSGIGKILTSPNGDLWMSSASVVWGFHVKQGTWDILPKQACEWVTCFSADSNHLIEAGGVNLIEIEVSSKPSRAAPASQVKKTWLTVTASENKQLEAGFKTNVNYQWISSIYSGRVRPRGVLAIQNLHDHGWRQLQDPDGIPNPPTTIALAGNDLWAGGEGAIALVDLSQCKVRKFCHIKTDSVGSIQVAGGYMWAQFDGHLYRTPLSSLQ